MPLSLTHIYTQHKSCTQQAFINIHASYNSLTPSYTQNKPFTQHPLVRSHANRSHAHNHTHKQRIHTAFTLPQSCLLHSLTQSYTRNNAFTPHSLVYSHACYTYAQSKRMQYKRQTQDNRHYMQNTPDKEHVLSPRRKIRLVKIRQKNE